MKVPVDLDVKGAMARETGRTGFLLTPQLHFSSDVFLFTIWQKF
jgi:hypothetical protein